MPIMDSLTMSCETLFSNWWVKQMGLNCKHGGKCITFLFLFPASSYGDNCSISLSLLLAQPTSTECVDHDIMINSSPRKQYFNNLSKIVCLYLKWSHVTLSNMYALPIWRRVLLATCEYMIFVYRVGMIHHSVINYVFIMFIPSTFN